MAASDEARQLLDAAEKDSRALGGMTDPDVFADEVFGFHAQQAVEKGLKAWIAALDAEYPRTHDISLLLYTLRNLGIDVNALYELIEFNPYAVQYRYEAFDDTGEALNRKAVCARINTLLQMIHTQIGF